MSLFQKAHPKHIFFKASSQGLGLFTEKPIKKGDIVFTMNGKVVAEPTQTSVQVGANEHMEDSLAKYLNHHCEPSCEVDRRKKALVALRNLKAGEEITFDYRKNEDKMKVSFQCRCCNKLIEGKLPAVRKTPAF